MTKYLTPSRLLNVGLILFIILLFFWKPCNKSADEVAKLKAENKALQQEKIKAVNQIAEARARYRSDSAEWRGMEQLAVIEKREADAAVQRQQNTIGRLAQTIRDQRHMLSFIDTINLSNVVEVTAAYKAACDSLPAEIDLLNRTLLEKDSAIDLWSSVLAYEIQLRDSAIEAEQKHSATLQGLYDRQNVIVENALAAARPRGRLLGGVGLIGNEINFLSGTKINLAYQSKGGKQYQVGGMIFKGGVYYEATVLVTLIK